MSGELRLWNAVVDLAIKDYHWEPVEMTNTSLYRIKCNAKVTAKWWRGTDDFNYVCGLADRDPEEVMKEFE